MVFAIPALEDIDPTGINGISRLDEVKASSRSAGQANHVAVRGEKGGPIGRIHDDPPGNNQHRATLGK